MGAHCAVIYTEKKLEAKEAAQRVLEILQKRGLSAEIYSAGEIIGKKLSSAVDSIIALGGDGTVLKSIKALSNSNALVLGINFGRGGFLMEAEGSMLDEAVESFLDGKYGVEKVMMISAVVNGEEVGDALNEIYVTSGLLGKTLDLRIVKKTELTRIIADGLIISTPIGSTAYAYSAGGPIVEDKIEAAVLVPVCPISNSRAMVLSLSEGLEVNILSEYGVSMLIDGFVKKHFDGKSVRLIVRKSEKTVNFVRLGLGESFARRLRKKAR